MCRMDCDGVGCCLKGGEWQECSGTFWYVRERSGTFEYVRVRSSTFENVRVHVLANVGSIDGMPWHAITTKVQDPQGGTLPKF